MKVMHLADVHLGAAPDSGRPWSEERKKEIWETFERAVAFAGKEKADLLLIAGDLFHRQPLLRELKEVNYQFSTIPETKVVIIAGNHDYIKSNSYYRTFVFSENVTFFREEKCQSVWFRDLNTEIYGISYNHREIREDLSSCLKPAHPERINVLLTHGGDEKHQPINMKKLAAAGFDYTALGHIHIPRSEAEGRVNYAGALEPVDCNDTGEHGFYIGEITKKQVKMKFHPFALRTYYHLHYEADKQTTDGQLKDDIRKKTEELGPDNLYRIWLEGRRHPDMEFDTERLMKLPNIVDVMDDTKPAYDMDKLLKSSGSNMIGRYIKRFQNAKEGSVEKQALYLGLQALLEAKKTL